MPSDYVDITGDWYGMMVHHPSRGVIHVSFTAENGSFKGEWDFLRVSKGAAKKGRFTAVRFVNWLNVRIVTRPLRDVQFQLTILKDRSESMITGIIPLEAAEIPFATVTLFRQKPADRDVDGLCPNDEFHGRRDKRQK